MKLGYLESAAKFMNYIEFQTASGGEERMNDVVERLTGRPSQKLDDWVDENKSAWQGKDLTGSKSVIYTLASKALCRL